jgi:hypothetical protein
MQQLAILVNRKGYVSRDLTWHNSQHQIRSDEGLYTRNLTQASLHNAENRSVFVTSIIHLGVLSSIGIQTMSRFAACVNGYDHNMHD